MRAEGVSLEIYALCEPGTRQVRYIGKAANARARLKSHLRDARRRKTPVYLWISEVLARGQFPSMFVIETCQDVEWKDRERSMIARYRQSSASLLNVAAGGNAPYCPDDVRAKNGRMTAKTRADTPEKAKIYRIKRDLGRLLADECCSDETKAKMRRGAMMAPHLFGAWATI